MKYKSWYAYLPATETHEFSIPAISKTEQTLYALRYQSPDYPQVQFEVDNKEVSLAQPNSSSKPVN